jgi:tetratricopeptide (TPR) repeat protein
LPPHNASKTHTNDGTTWRSAFISIWIAIGILSLVWWGFESRGCTRRFVLAAGLSLASFMVGSLIGFLFSSHGEEADTIGKVRDWVIGGITTLSIAKAGAIKDTITTFAADKGPNEFAIAFGGAVAYAALGFCFMYFTRELFLNPVLAESRRTRGIIEGTLQVSQVVKASMFKLPASILTGGDDVSDITNPGYKEAAKELKGRLDSDEVKAFLDQVNSAVADGTNLDWDTVSKAAYIQYYRTYFTEDDSKVAQARLAVEWILRALQLNPHHVDLTTKYADMLAIAGDQLGAVSILERMVHQPDAPLMVRQWLGYYLLFVPHRAADAIRYSNDYRALVGEDTDSLFNIACAYAQAYCEGPGAEPGLENRDDNHAQALDFLRQALQKEPDYADVVRTKWTARGESFECFAADPQFLALVGNSPNPGKGGGAPDPGGGTPQAPVGDSGNADPRIGKPLVLDQAKIAAASAAAKAAAADKPASTPEGPAKPDSAPPGAPAKPDNADKG